MNRFAEAAEKVEKDTDLFTVKKSDVFDVKSNGNEEEEEEKDVWRIFFLLLIHLLKLERIYYR